MTHQGTTIERNQVQLDPNRGELVRKHSVDYRPSEYEASKAKVERFSVIANWIVSAVTALLGIRVLLSLFGANPSALFAQFIYAVTFPLVLPFDTLFMTPAVGQATLDTAALVGLVVYPIAGYGLAKLVRAVWAPADPEGRAYVA